MIRKKSVHVQYRCDHCRYNHTVPNSNDITFFGREGYFTLQLVESANKESEDTAGRWYSTLPCVIKAAISNGCGYVFIK